MENSEPTSRVQPEIPPFAGVPVITDTGDRGLVIEQLESRFAKFEDLAKIPVVESDPPESLVPIEQAPGLTYFQRSPGLVPELGNQVFVREGISEMLKKAGEEMCQKYPGYSIAVLEGYRSLKQQTAEFNETVGKLLKDPRFADASSFDTLMASLAEEKDDNASSTAETLTLSTVDKQLLNEAHNRVAAPMVGDHVAGCGVDVVIIDENGVMVDMGTKMSEWIPESYTYSPFISENGMDSRTALLEVMVAAGFDNFEGEFWHFMSGGRESAYLHGDDTAKYGPTDFEDAELQKPFSELSKGQRYIVGLGEQVLLYELTKDSLEPKGTSMERAYLAPNDPGTPKMSMQPRNLAEGFKTQARSEAELAAAAESDEDLS